MIITVDENTKIEFSKRECEYDCPPIWYHANKSHKCENEAKVKFRGKYYCKRHFIKTAKL
jgi:hypothetical protein